MQGLSSASALPQGPRSVLRRLATVDEHVARRTRYRCDETVDLLRQQYLATEPRPRGDGAAAYGKQGQQDASHIDVGLNGGRGGGTNVSVSPKARSSISFSSSVGSGSVSYTSGSRITWQVEHAQERSQAPAEEQMKQRCVSCQGRARYWATGCRRRRTHPRGQCHARARCSECRRPRSPLPS